jgi:Fe-S-cluster containining protein
MKTPDFKAVERSFYADGYKLGLNAVREFKSNDNLFEAIKEMHKQIDTMIESFSSFAIQQNHKIDCKRGCSWCCYQPVFAMDYELEYLNSHIKGNFSDSKLKRINERAHNKKEKLKDLKDDDLLNSKFPCPLLEDGICIAYEVRPVACRIYLSKNVNSCIRFYNKPDDKTSFPELLDLPMRFGRMVNEGFKAGLKTGNIEPTEYRIEEKI